MGLKTDSKPIALETANYLLHSVCFIPSLLITIFHSLLWCVYSKCLLCLLFHLAVIVIVIAIVVKIFYKEIESRASSFTTFEVV